MTEKLELKLIVALAFVGIAYKFLLLPFTPLWADILAALIIAVFFLYIYYTKCKTNN